MSILTFLLQFPYRGWLVILFLCLWDGLLLLCCIENRRAEEDRKTAKDHDAVLLPSCSPDFSWMPGAVTSLALHLLQWWWLLLMCFRRVEETGVAPGADGLHEKPWVPTSVWPECGSPWGTYRSSGLTLKCKVYIFFPKKRLSGCLHCCSKYVRSSAHKVKTFIWFTLWGSRTGSTDPIVSNLWSDTSWKESIADPDLRPVVLSGHPPPKISH